MSVYYSGDPLSSPTVTSPVAPDLVTGQMDSYSTTDDQQDGGDTAYTVSRVNSVLIAFVIGLIILGFFFLIYYLIQNDANANALANLNTTGNSCAGQTCGDGFFCNGNGVCQPGAGDGPGASCGTSSDCMFGLTCLSSSHTCGNESNTTPVSNFTGAQLSTTIQGTKYYLVVEEPVSSSNGTTGGLNTSFLSPTMPNNYSFNYSTSQGLSFNSTDATYQGQFVSWGPNGQLTISPTPHPDLQLVQLPSGQIRLVNEICNDGQPLYRGDANRPTPEQSTAVVSTTSVSSTTTSSSSGLTSGMPSGTTDFTVSRVTGRSTKGVNCSPVARINGAAGTTMVNHATVGGMTTGTSMTGTTGNTVTGNTTTVSRTTGATVSRTSRTVNTTGTTTTRTTATGTTSNGTQVTQTSISGTTFSGTPLTGTPILKTYSTFFPRPGDNPSLSSKCPATWTPAANSRVVEFTLEYQTL